MSTHNLLAQLKKMRDTTGGLLFQTGTTVPTDAAKGYGTGCLFLHTDGTAGAVLYVNEGSITSCDFNALNPSNIDINALSAAVVDVAADSLAILDATDSSTKKEAIADIIAGVAGTGLSASSGVLSYTPHGLTEAAIANGDYVAFNDATDSNAPKKEALADVVALVAGTASATGLSASNSVLTVAANATNVAVAATVNDALVGVPFIVSLTTDSADLTDSYTVPAGRKLRVLDVVAIKLNTAGGAADTVQVFNGANPITNAISLNVADKTRVAATTLDDAYWDVAAGTALGVTAVEATTDADAQVNITCIWVTP